MHCYFIVIHNSLCISAGGAPVAVNISAPPDTTTTTTPTDTTTTSGISTFTTITVKTPQPVLPPHLHPIPL